MYSSASSRFAQSQRITWCRVCVSGVFSRKAISDRHRPLKASSLGSRIAGTNRTSPEALALGESLDIPREKLLDYLVGSAVAPPFVAAKRAEWHEYIAQVHQWELERYLESY